MRKLKALTVLLIMSIVVSLLPVRGSVVTAAETVEAHNFNFFNEQYKVDSARITTNERVTLTGTINNVSANSIKYSVYNINPNTGTTIQSNLNQTANITVNGTSITVFNIQLFPGMNRITFEGTQGASSTSESIYIEYRNSPMLYDLTAGLDGSAFSIAETGSTVVYSTNSRNKSSADISITGKAPNASKVTVIVGGKSNTYSINSSNDFSFVASPVNLKKGMNIVTIRVHNNSQYIETTRQIAFYNGDVTFYDLQLAEVGGSNEIISSTPMSSSTNFSVPSGANIRVYGKAIIPIVLNSTTDPAAEGYKNFTPHPGWIWDQDEGAYIEDAFNLLQGGSGFPPSENIIVSTDVNQDWGSVDPADSMVNPSPTAPSPSDKFITVEFYKDLGTSGSDDSPGQFDIAHTLKFTGWNQTKLPTPGTSDSNTFVYRLRNSSLAFIQDINYIPGYTETTDLQGAGSSDMENASIFQLPAAVELLIGNYDALGIVGDVDPDLIELASIKTVTSTYNLADDGDNEGDATSELDYSYKVLPQSYVTNMVVNGVETQFLRVFVTLNKLPSAGSMKLQFRLNAAGSASAEPYDEIPVTMLYGPFVKYNGLFDGQQIDYDTTLSSDNGVINLVQGRFDLFRGTLLNVTNMSDILYEPDTSGSTTKPQTVFFYVNNTQIKLTKDTSKNSPNMFILDDSVPDAEKKVFEALNKTGDNIFKFVFRTKTNNYESSVKVTIIPTNLPVIPKEGTDGVYPYSASLIAPLPNDPNFPKKGPVFTTKEAEMNVYGTFDFIDLGDTLEAAQERLGSSTLGGLGSDAENYFMEITVVGEKDKIVWNMGTNLFYNAKDPTEVITDDEGSDTPPANSNLSVFYDFESQSFSFILTNQKLPFDGSSKVYSIAIYNGGQNGPRATFRLEVDPTSIPYTIISPRSEKRTVNQSFVEVILTSPGADSVTINKVQASRITYLDYSTSTPTEVPAFRAFVKDLKPNKANRVDLIIQNANDTIKDSFNVTYTPENIPGSQTMLTMKSSIKAFDSKLNLTFPSGTNLIRRDYNAADKLKGQVYKDNNLVLAIANSEDGVVDRHDFETIPSNYDMDLETGKNLFTSSYPDRFVKISPVYWIDGGQADDPLTGGYDPISEGSDPYPFSVVKGVPTKLFFNRDADRELIPSKRGTLTLSYDPSMRETASTLISVFRFDPFQQQWENIGGVVNAKSNTIKVQFDRFGYYVVSKVGYSFNDVTSHPYARDAIEAVFAKGIMNAVDPSGAFGSDQYVTRGEFARMLVRALELPLNYEGPNHFVDVPNTGSTINMDALWDYRYIETAARAGFIRGTLPRVFSPDATISRQDATVMLAKALNMKLDTDPNKSRAALAKLFKDEPSIDFYAKPSVSAIAKKKFMGGSPVDASDASKGMVFEPTARLLRSDAAIIIAKVMVDQKKLPALYTQ